jgi:NAD(P)H-hydrate epimerase
MKILSAHQTKQLDEFTIENEPIDSLALMERASMVFVNWFIKHFRQEDISVHILCGPGNNGGDGLSIGRLLHHANYDIHLHLCKIGSQTSADYDQNLKRLPRHSAIACQEINKEGPMPVIPKGAIIIDGIFGSGLNRPVEGYWAKLIEHLNTLEATRVAIDIPSGMFADQYTAGTSFTANYTFSFELPKLGFLFPENNSRVGQWATASIGLHPQGLQTLQTNNYYVDQTLARSLYRPREKYSHKGTYGHALVMAGSYGMFGAALLTAKAALRAGAGLVSLHTAKAAYNIVQTALPEVMADMDEHEHYISSMPDLDRYSVIGAGPGLGKHESTRAVIYQLVKTKNKPLVLDADALNILSKQSTLLSDLPEDTIITPHPKEFERLFGPTDNNFKRIELQRKKAKELKIIIVLKGAHTSIATPAGDCYFNSTGNPGMATGGSGDVLTGIITGLLAQSYSAVAAAILGVYLHGLAGDIAIEKGGSEEALIAGDLIEHLGFAFRQLRK